MPTYLYEIIPADPKAEPVYYEVTHEADEPAHKIGLIRAYLR